VPYRWNSEKNGNVHVGSVKMHSVVRGRVQWISITRADPACETLFDVRTRQWTGLLGHCTM
jgi:hypothetical protein